MSQTSASKFSSSIFFNVFAFPVPSEYFKAPVKLVGYSRS